MLEQRDWRGHFFVVTDRVGAPGFVTEQDIRALASRGHVIGSHSHSHPIMTKLGDAAIRAEWETSRKRLEEILDMKVNAASVPTGFYMPRVGRLAIEAGYRHLFTSEPWLRPRAHDGGTIYGRFSITRGSTAESVRGLCTFSRATIARQRFGWQSRKALKRALGPAYEGLRELAIKRR
jgi:peptidoglycan/xylan/chitin deacetylase (PgdA/CDA1 family)